MRHLANVDATLILAGSQLEAESRVLSMKGTQSRMLWAFGW